MALNADQQAILNAAAAAVRGAWQEQWSMIEDLEEVLGAEYLMTGAVARSLAELKPGQVRIEKLVRRAFFNSVMRRRCATPVPPMLRQGRIDVVVSSDTEQLEPYCLVELKRNDRMTDIAADADRIATLLHCTGPYLPSLFGICLFPIILKAEPSDPPSYARSRASRMASVKNLAANLRTMHATLLIDVATFPALDVTRPSVVLEACGDDFEEVTWDKDGFRMEPVAITIQKR